MCSSIVDPLNQSQGILNMNAGIVSTKKILTFDLKSIYLFAVVNGDAKMNANFTTKGYLNFGRFFFSFRSVHPAG